MDENLELYLEQAYKQILEMIEVAQEIASDIRNKADYSRIADVLECVTRAIAVFAATKELEHGIETDNEAVKELCQEIIEGIQGGDSEVIADIIEFEFLPMLKEWEDELDKYYQK